MFIVRLVAWLSTQLNPCSPDTDVAPFCALVAKLVSKQVYFSPGKLYLLTTLVIGHVDWALLTTLLPVLATCLPSVDPYSETHNADQLTGQTYREWKHTIGACTPWVNACIRCKQWSGFQFSDCLLLCRQLGSKFTITSSYHKPAKMSLDQQNLSHHLPKLHVIHVFQTLMNWFKHYLLD